MLIFFIVALLLSGITAFPIWSELRWLMESGEVPENTLFGDWLHKVWLGVNDAQQQAPFLFYGFDWLAFAHLVIALLFVGPYRDPVKNKWVIQWGMLTCLCIIPLALIAGPARQIPWFHILIDCSFGIFGLIPLGLVLRWIRRMEMIKTETIKPA